MHVVKENEGLIREWFHSHKAELHKNKQIEKLVWSKCSSNLYKIVYIVDGNTLFVSGDVGEAIYKHGSGIKIIPAGISLEDLSGTDINKISKVFSDIDKKAEIIIVDSAAGLGKESIVTMGAADEIFVVTTPDITSVTDSLKAVKVLYPVGLFNSDIS